MKILITHALFAILFCLSAKVYAQSNTPLFHESEVTFVKSKEPLKPQSDLKKSDRDLELLWGEDFSNGFEGQSDNGPWTFGLSEGELWFITSPSEYNPNQALIDASPLYGTKIPLFYFNTQIINSPTRDNGVAMLDADRYNSTATVEFPNDGQMTTNPVHAILESPAIDLSGNTFARLTYQNFSKMCCGFPENITVEFSTDGGSNWIDLHWVDQLENPLDMPNQQEMAYDLSDYLNAATNLSDCRIRFKWNGGHSHFYWMLDDFKIEALGNNDLVAGKTYYNNYFEKYIGFANNEISSLSYYRSMEYTDQPTNYASLLNLAAEVSNAGSEIQTGVKLTVTATPPTGGTPLVVTSNEITLAPGEASVLKIPDVSYTSISPTIENGTYTFDYLISQDQEDITPDDNMGPERTSEITSENNNDGLATLSNARESYDGAFPDLGQDVIWGTIYSFPPTTLSAPKVITRIETVLLKDQQVALTQPGEAIYFNVRQGSVLKENPAFPSTMTSVFFDNNSSLTYEDESLEYIIQAEDLWSPSDGMPYQWVSFELPTPILIDPNKVYQAEFRVPASSAGIVFSPVSNHQEPYASVRYDYDLADWVWLGNLEDQLSYVVPIRFKTTSQTSSIEKISSQQGLELVQNYPNPMRDITTIQYRSDKNQSLTLELLDSSGKLVLRKSLGAVTPEIPYTYQLQRNDLAAGVYTYTLRGSDSVVSRKLVIE